MTSVAFLSIPVDNDCDVHICGRCKIIFYVLSDFMEHKLTNCGEIKENEPTKFEEKQYNSLMKDNERRDPLVGNYVNQLAENTNWPIRSSCTASDNVKLEHQEELDKPASYRKKEKFKCPVDSCDYSTFLMKDIKRHLRTHTGERPFKCMLCPKMFTRKDKFKVHLRIHKGEKKYKCPECDYAAVESNSLVKHSRIHNGQKPFKCQLCSYSARDKSQLTVHLRMHTGDSPYICTHEKCKAAFKTSTGLKRHASVHSPKTPQPCPYCVYKTNLKTELVLHVRKKHANEEDSQFKSYDCPHCVDKFFTTKSKFKAHLKAKHDTTAPQKKQRLKDQGVDLKRAHECQQCEASFVCPESLRTHERQHEKNSDRPHMKTLMETLFF